MRKYTKSVESERKLQAAHETHKQRMETLRLVTEKMKQSNAKLRAYLKLPEPTSVIKKVV